MMPRAASRPAAVELRLTVRPGLAAVLLAVTAAVLGTASVLQHLLTDTPEPVRWLDLDNEQSIATWFQTSTLLGAATLGALIARARRRGSSSYALHWAFVALILVLLSVDEAVSFHERSIVPLLGGFETSGFFYFAWLVPGVVVVVVFAAAYSHFLLSLDRRTQALFLGAAVLYLGGAVGMEGVNGAYLEKHPIVDHTYELMTDVEEVLEMAGLVVLVYALLSVLAGNLRTPQEPSSAMSGGMG